MKDAALLSLAITPKTAADRKNLAHGFQKLMAEDPTIRVKTDEATGAVIISATGEVHLEIIVGRLKQEFGVDATVGRPQVVYKKTVMRFQDAARKATPVLLEPVMRVEIRVSPQHKDEVIGNLSSRRGQIQSEEVLGGMLIINARVPLAEMFGYSCDLRERTQGRGTFAMQFDDYQPCPPPGDDDRDSLVGSLRRPLHPLRDSAIALPEPSESDEDPDGKSA